MKDNLWLQILTLSSILITSYGEDHNYFASKLLSESQKGECELPSSWGGTWFQLGSGKETLHINSTFIETKGTCTDMDGDKFVFHDTIDKCYRCLVMHKKHSNVLQYKETFCTADGPHSAHYLCNEITGDAPLLSMFRMDGQGVPCPFKAPPFQVSYSKGHGDCDSPPSRADPCTDDTRLVFRFQACPDVEGTESAVEELECLATWREGTIHYLVGRFHHKMAMTDEEKFRCFVYHKQPDHSYLLAQSGEATCAGLLSPTEGSRNMKLTKIEGQHMRCKFPSWVTQHYHWRSLDYSHSFHFSHRNASLKISTRAGATETKLVCHSVQAEKSNMARIIVHVISGCVGGYKCMTLHKRDSHVIQMQLSEMSQSPSEACLSTTYESSSSPNTITMITGVLPTVKCPLEGRYSPIKSDTEVLTPGTECTTQQTGLQGLYMACPPSYDTMEFEPTCRSVTKTAYSCHGSWHENGTTYVVGSPVSRHSTDARHYCFILSHSPGGLTIERVEETCSIAAKQTDWAFNITEIGKCVQNGAACHGLYTLALLPLIASLALLRALR